MSPCQGPCATPVLMKAGPQHFTARHTGRANIPRRVTLLWVVLEATGAIINGEPGLWVRAENAADHRVRVIVDRPKTVIIVYIAHAARL